MIRSAARPVIRQLLAPRLPIKTSNCRRFLSTAPASQKSSSWKSSAARWAIAVGGIYYYNTSSVFAEQPDVAISRLEDSIHHIQESNLPTLEAIAAEKRERQAERQAREAQVAQTAQTVQAVDDESEGPSSVESSVEGLEEEADQQGAFNPETGEINWDCPCLGGMAHGPCGEEFKAAFSCFVYSKEEPKGIECIDKFKGMQECFREHPDMYGSELEDDEDEVEEELEAAATTHQMKNQGEAESSISGEPDSSRNTSRKLPNPGRAINPSESAERSEAAADEGGKLVHKAKKDDAPKQ